MIWPSLCCGPRRTLCRGGRGGRGACMRAGEAGARLPRLPRLCVETGELRLCRSL